MDGSVMTKAEHLWALRNFVRRYIQKAAFQLPSLRNTTLVFKRQTELRQQLFEQQAEPNG